MRIPMVISRNFWVNSIWGTATRTGVENELKRKKYEPFYIYDDEYRSFDFEAFFKNDGNRLVLVIGSSKHWISETYDFLKKQNIETLVVCNKPPRGIDPRGIIKIDYESGTDMLIRHFLECGCTGTALYGYYHDSTTDETKRIAYEKLSDSYAVFENREGLDECYNRLKEQLDSFDSVLCVNDICAVSLVDKLIRDGIKVPNDIQVACFGSSSLSELFTPAITHITMTHEDIGNQAVSAYVYMCHRAGKNIKLQIEISGEIVQGDTTKPSPKISANKSHTEPDTDKKRNFFNDREITDFSELNNLLENCDRDDIAIIKKSLEGKTSQTIAGELSFSVESVRYRKKQIAKLLNFNDFSELIAYIRGNRFGSVLSKLK